MRLIFISHDEASTEAKATKAATATQVCLNLNAKNQFRQLDTVILNIH